MRSNIINLTLTDADTEYPVALTRGHRHFTFQCRTDHAVRFATETGKVATSVAPFATLKAGAAFSLPDNFPSAAEPETWYFASSEAGVVVEIVESYA